MLLRIAEISTGVVAVTGGLVGEGPVWRGGTLLALLGFMIFQNYRQQRSLQKVIVAKDEQILKHSEELKALELRRSKDANILADAITRQAQALEDRPCLSGDQRVDSRPQT